MSKFYFTFGFSQGHDNCYTVIEAKDINEAREEMFRRYGNKWSMEYTEDEWIQPFDKLNYYAKVELNYRTGRIDFKPNELIPSDLIYGLKRIQ